MFCKNKWNQLPCGRDHRELQVKRTIKLVKKDINNQNVVKSKLAVSLPGESC